MPPDGIVRNSSNSRTSISVSFTRERVLVDVSDLPVGEAVIITYKDQENLCLKAWNGLVSLSNPDWVWDEDGKVDVVRHVKKLEIKEVT